MMIVKKNIRHGADYSCLLYRCPKWFFAKTVQDRNDDAAKKVERKFKQYKRVHQDLLKKIVAGQERAALTELETILSVVPADGESHYMKCRLLCETREIGARYRTRQASNESGYRVITV